MRRLLTGRAMAPALFLTAGLLVVAGGATAQPGKERDKIKDKDKGPKAGPEGKAAKDLQKAFDRLTELSQTPPAGKAGGKLLDLAQEFYRAGVRAYPESPWKAAAAAAAVNDTVRGLDHLRRASLKAVAGLPEPPAAFDGPPPPADGPKEKFDPKGKDDGPKGKEPPAGPAAGRGPWSESLDALTRSRDRLAAAGDAPARGPGRDFLDAAKATYGQARAAYEAGEYRRAGELARAAEAWSNVPGHLARAGWDGPAAPVVAPEPRRKGPGVPPPPPPLAD
jgi:hypothetical protein